MNLGAPLLRWLTLLSPVCCCLFSARGILHFFQLESYQFPGYFRSLKRNRVHSFLPGLCSCVAVLVLLYCFDLLALREARDGSQQSRLSCSAAVGRSRAFDRPRLFSQTRQEEVRAHRPRKAPLCRALSGDDAHQRPDGAGAMGGLSRAVAAFAAAGCRACGLLAWPLEKAISECYFRDARRKLLSNPKLVRIGITGSYGKTSVKHILGTILSEKYPTLITPASFNTPMASPAAIREKLLPSHQIFVGEMGARHVGDIREMCRLVHPTIGIITSVGPQHLETFKTIERVAATKYELIEALPAEGSHSYFYDDASYVRQMYERTRKPKTLCGTDPEHCDCWCDEVRVSAEGSHFTLHIRGLGSIECQTRLLGEHSIHNILLAAAVAADLGLTLRQISHGVEKLAP